MIGSEHISLPLQDIGVQVARLVEAALGAQHVSDLELQVQRLRVVGAELMGPEVLQPLRQVQARLDTHRASTGIAPSRSAADGSAGRRTPRPGKARDAAR